MTVLTLLRTELRRLVATPLSRLAFAALMLVPLLYGGLYLWGNQDPYAKLDHVPAALVVADTGTTVDGKTVNYGKDVASDITDDASFDWSVVSATKADEGVRDGTYDFSVTLPADFSTALTSSDTTSPRQGLVVLQTNDVNSYLSSTIAGQAATSIRTQIAQQVGEEAADRFLVGFSTIRGDLSDAADGADQLQTGAAQAASGASSLADGTRQVADGAQTLASGLDTLDSSAAALPDSAAQLASGAQSAADGAAALSTGAGQLASGASALPAYGDVRAELAARLMAGGLSQDQVSALLAGLDQYGAGVDSLKSGAQTLAGQTPALASGAAAVAAGAEQLSSSAPDLVDAIDQADAGADQLAAGASSAADGAATLSSGVASLQSGAADLSSGLHSGVQSIPDGSADQQKSQAATIGNPVVVKTDEVTEAGSYGAGLAPFFLTLAAWIGLYALFLIVKPLSRRAITALVSPWKVTLAGWLTPGLLGVVQALVLFLLTTVALRFSVAEPLAMFGFMALTALTFAAILLALNALLGSVGQFLGLVLMVVQLVTAGGTFPWQTLPAPLAFLHHLLPMSYGVDGLRQLMYGGSGATAAGDALVLAGWLLVALLATLLTTARMTSHRTLRDLRPSLIG